MNLPWQSETDLDEHLSRPHPAVVEMMGRLPGDLLVLGVGGKMGLSLAQAACRAAQEAGVNRRVIGVSRFSDSQARERLEQAGVQTIVADLLDRQALAALPDAENVVYMAGRKFGTQGDASLTWAANVLAPGLVGERYPASRIVAFSTGCVYPLVARTTGGCKESHPPNPVGEYAQSALGRERVFEYASRRYGTSVCLLRLNYAIDLRYGVLHDIALRILEERPVDLAMGAFNCIWQGDAVNQALRALELCASPPRILNVTGPEVLATREVAKRLGRALKRRVVFAGRPADTAYLNDAQQATGLFGPPTVSIEEMIEWTARWVQAGGRSHGLPTHFEVRNGTF